MCQDKLNLFYLLKYYLITRYYAISGKRWQSQVPGQVCSLHHVIDNVYIIFAIIDSIHNLLLLQICLAGFELAPMDSKSKNLEIQIYRNYRHIILLQFFN